MAKKQYENFMVFGARIYGMKNLWTPSTEFKGQQTKPNYLAGFMVPKTQVHWSQEPLLSNLWAAMQKIHAATMSQLGYEAVGWPIRDGDLPQDPQTPPAEWARGHWMFSGNSGDVIKVELTQGQNVVPLQARGNIVKPGDFCIVGGACAVNSQNNRAIKLYINNVVFTAPGEEIAVGNSVSGAELMAAAAAQGYRPTGFNPSSGGFGGAPQGGFAPQGQGGFGGPQQGGFTPGASAPMTGGPAMQAAPGQFQPAPGGFGAPQTMAPGGASQFQPNPAPGSVASHSNGFGGAPGFTPPGAFPGR